MAETSAASSSRTDAVRELEAEFGELITRFQRVISEIANRVSPGLLPGAYKVFTTIARRDGVTLSTLADHLMMDKGQLSRTIRELESLGLISRAPDPADGRSSLLSATAEGRGRLEAARAPQQGLLLDAIVDWPLDDIHALTRLLHALGESVTRR
ncbi:MarR family transcriptional regulator [Microbacterium hominis]|uniref:MarR family transcriptional regulator n=1 Tax=Microbacterium hominis TaxID=162426 RepID=A0A134DIS3_9MICO|nr:MULTISPECIES: MarR family transcriptional regulator [Microbacterium]AUG28850.1 MarR family transcriptional regulator [Microbacterium hominis]KXC06455.1 transcriptional regulator [Microbacterium hominis]QOC24593.1 MarR family transcriptional regulator [Microbacterium hominis]QOC28657.1 MarR family transcriptional regulator [Microbacterium hominis]QRY40294.1 MarR family transcriptional regulator [Microbacterium hominis]